MIDAFVNGNIEEDLTQLFRILVFNVLVGNRDDHLRNHRFICEPSGWRLSAAFDMNPSLARAEHALTLDGASAAPNMNAVLNTAELYRLERASDQAIVAEVNSAVLTWRDEAQQCGLPSLEIKRMEGAFQA